MNYGSCHNLYFTTSANDVFGPKGIYCLLIYKITLVTSGNDEEQLTSVPFKRVYNRKNNVPRQPLKPNLN